jgi:hypothetical protein
MGNEGPTLLQRGAHMRSCMPFELDELFLERKMTIGRTRQGVSEDYRTVFLRSGSPHLTRTVSEKSNISECGRILNPGRSKYKFKFPIAFIPNIDVRVSVPIGQSLCSVRGIIIHHLCMLSVNLALEEGASGRSSRRLA